MAVKWGSIGAGAAVLRFSPLGLLRVVVSTLVFPRQLIKWRPVAASAVAIFRQVELLMFVVFDVSAVLIAPTLPFSIKAARWFHRHRV